MKLILKIDDLYKMYLKTRSVFQHRPLEEMARTLFYLQVEFIWCGGIRFRDRLVNKHFRFTARPIDQKAKLIELSWSVF